MKTCPYCSEEIQENAVKCKFCGEFIQKQSSRNKGVLKRLFLDWKRKDVDLSSKWWHRLFKVFFVFTIVLFFAIASTASFISLGEENYLYLTSIKENLRNYTKNNSSSENTVPSFIKDNKQIGCFEDNKIRHLYSFELEDNICYANIRENIDSITNLMLGSNSGLNDFDELKKELLKNLENEKEYRYCYISNETKCSSDKIVSYERNFLFYLTITVISIISTLLYILAMQLLYYKVYLYIIYGRDK